MICRGLFCVSGYFSLKLWIWNDIMILSFIFLIYTSIIQTLTYLPQPAAYISALYW